MTDYNKILLSCQIIDRLNKNKIPYSIDADCYGFFDVETQTDELLWFRFYNNELKVTKHNNKKEWKVEYCQTYTYKEIQEGKYEEIENLLDCQTVKGEAPYIDYKNKIAVMLEIVEFLNTNKIPFETISAVSGCDTFGRDTLGSVFNANFWIDFFESGFSIYERNPDKEKIEEYIDRRKNLIGFTYTEFLRYEPKPPYINKTKKKFYNALIGFNK